MKKELVFYGIVDFYKKKEKIKSIYDCLDTKDMYLYKMYVYSLPFMDDSIKDLIWDYLNGYDDEKSRIHLENIYIKAKCKLDKRRLEAQNINEEGGYNDSRS